MKLVVDRPTAPPHRPPVTPRTALTTALTRADEFRRVVVIAQDGDDLVQVNWSTMAEADAHELVAVGARLLAIGLRAEPAGDAP